MHFMRDTLKGAVLLPTVLWLAGMAAFTLIGVESLFADSHAAFVYARLSAYLATLLVAALTLGLLTLFGLGCAVMLWWLDDALDGRRIAAAVGMSLWPVGGLTWIGVALLLLEPPAAVTLAEMMQPDAVETDLESVPAFFWWKRLGYVAPGAFLLFSAWLLSRATKPVSGILAVAFGAALVMALVSALAAISGSFEM